jgi:hypothetical protein
MCPLKAIRFILDHVRMFLSSSVLGQVELEYDHTSCGLFLTKAVFTRRRIKKVTSVRGQYICFTPLMISLYVGGSRNGVVGSGTREGI